MISCYLSSVFLTPVKEIHFQGSKSETSCCRISFVLTKCTSKKVERHCRIILLLCVWAKLWLRVEASSKEALRAGDLQIKLQVTMSRDSSNLHRPPWLSGGGDLCWIATTQRSSGRFHLNRLFATWDCNGWTIQAFLLSRGSLYDHAVRRSLLFTKILWLFCVWIPMISKKSNLKH